MQSIGPSNSVNEKEITVVEEILNSLKQSLNDFSYLNDRISCLKNRISYPEPDSGNVKIPAPSVKEDANPPLISVLETIGRRLVDEINKADSALSFIERKL